MPLLVLSRRAAAAAILILSIGLFAVSASGQVLDPATGEEMPIPQSLDGLAPEIFAPPARGGESLNLLGRLADGETRGLDLVGDILYRSNGGYLETLDVSDPLAPVVLGRFLIETSMAMSVAVEGNYAYVPAQRANVFANRGSLQIVDISDPSNLVGVGSVTGRSFYDVHVEGTTIYAAALGGGLRIYDASDPTNPEELGFVTIPGGSVLSVAKDGDIVYVAAGGAGMHAIDVSDPTAPTIVGSFSVDLYPEISEFATGITYANGYAFVSAQPLGLIIVDASDPSDPTEVSHYLVTDDGNGQIRTVVVDGDTAFLGKDDGMIALDISDMEDITRIGTLDFGVSGSSQSILLDGTTAWVGNRYHGVRVVDVSNPAEMEHLTLIHNGGFAFKVKVLDDIAYVSDLLGQLRLIDFSDPANPTELGRVTGLFSPYRVDVLDGVAYVAHQGTFENPAGEVTRIDVSDPANPTIIDVTSISTYANGVHLVGGTAFVAAGMSGTGQGEIQAYDIETMSLLGSADAGNTAFDVRVVDGIAYVATFGSGLTVLDVTDPAAMAPLSIGEIGGVANSLELDGSTIYMADLSFSDPRGLTVIDVSDPANPQELGSGNIIAGGTAVDVAQHADLAYVTVDMVGLYQYDVSDPTAITESAYIVTSNRATGVDTQDELVIVVDTGTGIWIFEAPGAVSNEEVASVETLRVESAYPNPFSTVTTVQYHLPESGHVSVTVHDILGREVARPVDGVQSLGMNEVLIEGSTLASGVYFVRVATAGESIVRQITLVR